MSKIIHKKIVNLSPKMNAFPYQSQAFEFLKDLDYGAIFHEQGLGKTKIAIDLLLYWLQHRDIDTVLIVTKKQLVNNWLEEFCEHTFLTPKVLSSNKRDNFYVFNSETRVVITNFETLSTEKERVKLFLKSRNVGIIIDESAKLKNPDAKITQDYFDLSNLFKIKIIMTGTPVANRPYDIWAQIYFLDGGRHLGNKFEDFKSNTDLRNDLAENTIERENFERHTAEIFDLISDFSIRETKSSCGIKLPQKVYETIECEFEKHQKDFYDKILYELRVEITKDGNKILDDNEASLKRLLRLNQAASNPRLISDNYTECSGKEKRLEELLQRIIAGNEKCIVWTSFIENVDYLSKKYKQFGAKKIHGKMAIADRNKSVTEFKTNPECKVLIATPQSAKEGLTLTVANHVIFYDRSFNLDDYLQAQDRIHRISQKKTCYIYNLSIRNSIDEWIACLIEAKHYAAMLAQGDIELSEYSHYADYSYGELIKEILKAGEE